MKKLHVLFAILAICALLFTGNANAGGLTEKSVTMPDGRSATIIAHEQILPNWMIPISSLHMNCLVVGDVTKEKLAMISKVEDMSRNYTKSVTPNAFVSVSTNTLLYTAVGYIGVGLGSMAFPTVIPRQYAWYGAAATGFVGLANSLISLGYKNYTFEIFGQQFFAQNQGFGITVLIKSPL